MSEKRENAGLMFEEETGGYMHTFNLIREFLKTHKGTTINAAIKRLSNICDREDFVYSTASGGKDSAMTSVMFAFVVWLRREVERGNMTLESYNELVDGETTMENLSFYQKPGLMTMDTEMMYSFTSDGLERMFKAFCGRWEIGDLSWVSEKKEENPYYYTKEEILAMPTEEIQKIVSGYGEEPILDGYWQAFPIAWENTASVTESRYWSFDSNKKDVWTRNLPVGNYVWNQENFYEFPVRNGLPTTDEKEDICIGQTDQSLRTKTSKYFKRAINEKFQIEQELAINDILDANF